MKTAYELNGMEKTLRTFFSSGKQKYNIIIKCELCVPDLFFALRCTIYFFWFDCETFFKNNFIYWVRQIKFLFLELLDGNEKYIDETKRPTHVFLR